MEMLKSVFQGMVTLRFRLLFQRQWKKEHDPHLFSKQWLGHRGKGKTSLIFLFAWSIGQKFTDKNYLHHPKFECFNAYSQCQLCKQDAGQGTPPPSVPNCLPGHRQGCRRWMERAQRAHRLWEAGVSKVLQGIMPQFSVPQDLMKSNVHRTPPWVWHG